jgi:hypothetical protein
MNYLFRYLLTVALFIVFFGRVELLFASETLMTGERLVGGPCEYKVYSGAARIVSVQEHSSSLHTVNKQYEVLFTFQPDNVITESFVQTEGRTFSLEDDFKQPDQEFVRRYGISQGSIHPCVIKVIVRGTCTPVIFEFPFTEQNKK